MKVFSRQDAVLLRSCINALNELVAGKRAPRTHQQEKFVRVANGKAVAVTQYEKAYLRWLERKPDIEEYLNAIENSNNQIKLAKGKKKRRHKKNSEKQSKIKNFHRVSGFNKIRAHFVSGGAVRPK